MMYRAAIVDDEPKSVKSLQSLLAHYAPDVAVVGTAYTALEAVGLIFREKPDVVFLDIQMPGQSGFDVLGQVSSLPLKVVFTTAHKEYAIAAIKGGAFDYLLKPIDPDDLLACLDRVRRGGNPHPVQSPLQVNLKDGVLFIHPHQIIKLVASGSYTELYLDTQVRVVASKVLKEFEALLDPKRFYRCHNSYIVNLSKIKKLLHEGGFFVELEQGHTAEVAKKNRVELLERMRLLEVGGQ